MAIPIAAIVAYSNATAGPFIFDDTDSIVENTFMRSENLAECMAAPRKSSAAGRPVVSLSLAANYRMSGDDPRGYHVFNIAVHAVTAVVLFAVLLRIVRGRDPDCGVGLPAAVALIFAVHPLGTDAVNQVIYRTELLGSLFYLLTLYAAMRAARSRISALWIMIALTCSAVGMGCKEFVFSVPLAVFLLDGMVLFPSWRLALSKRWLLYGGLCLTWVVLWTAMFDRGPDGTWERVRQDAIGDHAGMPYGEYWLTQSAALVHYVRLVLWPSPLILDYGEWPIGGGFVITWSVIVVAAMVAGVLWLWRRRPDLAFLWILGFFILAPTTLLPNRGEVVGEHRMYLPMIAVIASVAAAVGAITRRFAGSVGWQRALITCITAGACIAATTATRTRNTVYSSKLAVWQDTVDKWPHGARAYNGVADALRENDDLLNAVKYYEKSLELDDDQTQPRLNLGGTLQALGRDDDAIPYFQHLLGMNPHPQTAAKAHNNLASSMRILGRLEECTEHYLQAIALNPRLVQAQHNLGLVYKDLDRDGAAVEQFRRALELNPQLPEAHYQLGYVLFRNGDTQTAIPHLKSVIALNSPIAYLAHDLLGQINTQDGDLIQARAHFEAFVQLQPSMAEARYNLGFLLVQMEDYEAAVGHLEVAVEILPGFEAAARQLDYARSMLQQ
jgi:tetratricopeptide (TPR) repeat protein